MIVARPVLPYDCCAPEPATSADTLVFHFSQHQRGNFDQAAALVRSTKLGQLTLEELVRRTARTPAPEDGAIQIVTTSNTDSPIVRGHIPLLGPDALAARPRAEGVEVDRARRAATCSHAL